MSEALLTIPPAQMPGHIEGVPYRLGPWNRGFQYNLPAELVEFNGLFAGQECRIGNAGQLLTRGGFIKKGGMSAISGIPTITGVGTIRFSSSSTKDWIVANSKFFEDDQSGTLTDRTGGLTLSALADSQISSAVADGKLYGTDGVNAPFVWAAAGGNIAAAGISSKFTVAKFCHWWDGRLWWWNTNTDEGEGWCSDLNNREVISEDAYQIKAPIVAVNSFRNRMYIHTPERIYILTPTGGTPPYRIEESFPDAAEGPVAVLPNGIMAYPKADGIYTWDGARAPVKLSDDLDGDRYWDSVQQNASRLPYSHVIVYRKLSEVWFWLPHGNVGASRNNHVMVYNYKMKIWYGPYRIARNCSTIIDREPYAGGYSLGLCFQHQSGTNDDGTAIDAWFEPSAKAPEGEWLNVRWLLARFAFEGLFTSNNLSVTQKSAGITPRQTSFDLGGQFDTIGITFKIGISAIAGSGLIHYHDVDMYGWYPNSQWRCTNAIKDEVFNIRFIWNFYQPHGIVRRRTVGVD